MTARVLLVDDDRSVRDALGQTLELADYDATLVGSYIEAKDHIQPDFDGVVVTDIRMSGKDGFALLDYARGIDPDLPVILLTGEGDIPMAVKGISAGAFEFLEKPCNPNDLLAVIERAQKARRLVMENRRLKHQLEAGDAASRMIFGQSRLVEQLRARVRGVAKAGAEVLVHGEPGTGVAKVAEVIHLLSPEAMRPFRKVAAASFTADTIASAVENADGGTLFIDEIADLSATAQFALLGALENPTPVRLIAGTYRDLQNEALAGRFNPDLYYRLDVMSVRIPAIRERAEDIPVLFRHYVTIACEQADLPIPEITPDTLSRLMAQDWPGNARSLMNAAMRFAMGLSEADDAAELGLTEQLAKVERSLLIEALRRQAGNATDAAKALKLPRKTFYDKLMRHGIRADRYRD